ncbi:Lipoxygenase [Trema orientale]|uniref:Lipoxygenase n=1 Tax=Trema orientale TaxID=63057 RepID=A0A2P5E739_TREOI|nr:Lipoxygenase [Trema orientale]
MVKFLKFTLAGGPMCHNRPVLPFPHAYSREYPGAGYLPNRPTMRGLLNMKRPGKARELRTLVAISFIEMLSKRASDEVYLGQRDSPNWTTDIDPLEAFERFGKKLSDIARG